MPQATIELKDLILPASIGTYGPSDTVPDAHVLNMTLSIDPNLVLVASDGMSNVFDYDPLIDTIYLVSRDCHYDTQEWLISRIAGACAAYTEITSIEVGLHKSPVRDGSGALGVRLKLNAKELADLR
ncbi:MAG: dihydroneopterin aldolase [Yoonia sp.]|nr:dihydroneopterin aldolase [Paracoccaceae bacterium]